MTLFVDPASTGYDTLSSETTLGAAYISSNCKANVLH